MINKVFYVLTFSSIFFGVCLFGFMASQGYVLAVPVAKTDTIYVQQELTEWQIFTMALIEVESRYNTDVVGSADDSGVLQLTPIYVREVNRIQTDTSFSMEDRFCPERSLKMFAIMQAHYNESFDIDKAIKLHNPHASESYRLKIYKVMDEVRKRELVRSHVISQ